MSFLNQAERELFLLTIAARTALELSSNCEKFKVGTARIHAKTAIDHIDQWEKQVLNVLDNTQCKALKRSAQSSRMRLVSKYSIEATQEHILAPVEPLTRLVSGVVMDCIGCIKSGKEINKCQRRRDLIACGITPPTSEKDICGFETGGFID